MSATYTIYLSDGVTNFTIPPNTINSHTSLLLPGQNTYPWGEKVVQDLVHLLENSAHTSAPSNPLTGQIWYDKNTASLKVYNGTSFNLVIDPADYVNTAGDTMTGPLVLSGAPVSNLHAATKLYVDTADNTKLNLAGGTLTGNLVLNGDPTLSMHAATKQYVDTNDGLKVSKSGDSMSGFLLLNADPTSALHAATKSYVDTGLGTKLSLGGGTLTGPLTLNANPTTSLQAATKQYVDSAVGISGGVGFNVLYYSQDFLSDSSNPTITPGFSYVVGHNQILVFFNGVKMRAGGFGITENSSTTFVLNNNVHAGDYIEVYKIHAN